jgi:methionine-rich copper-binding protein CopC
LLNNGDDKWPIGCHLQFTGGDILSSEERILVESLSPKQTTSVAVQLKAPQEPGMYKSKWRMVTPTGAYFGGMFFNRFLYRIKI